jgi:hypothetical protein
VAILTFASTPANALPAAAATVVAHSLPAAGATTAPSTVVILIPGFGTQMSSSTYNPLTQGSSALTSVESDFDPTSEPATCNAVPNLTTTLTNHGALILPFSYNGTTLTGPPTSPTMNVVAYGGSAPGNTPSETLPSVVAPLLATEVSQVHALWPNAHVVIVGHSEGGYVAETYFASSLFSASQDPEVNGIFSLDAPLNGVENTTEAGLLLKAIGVKTSPALLALFNTDWQNAATNDAAVLEKDNGTTLYVPVGTPGDNIYRLTDGSADPLISQVLVNSAGQAVFGQGSPNFLDPATPPQAGLTDPLGVLASHQCVMDNASVITQISARVVPPGYREVASDGGIFAFDEAQFYGSMGGAALNRPVVGIAATPDGQGYREVASDGGIFAFGDAQFSGSMGGIALNKPVVGIATTPDGQGYWEAASDGGIFAFGDARFYGSMAGIALNGPVVGIAATRDGQGYWEVASDGGIFAFGDAQNDGSMGGLALNKPVVGIAATPDGQGYWEVASDGGIFAFGDARFDGSMAGATLDKPVVGISTTPDGQGYWEVAADGGIFSFGDAQFFGSMGGTALNKPVSGVAAASS